jgi:hypothetical protein
MPWLLALLFVLSLWGGWNWFRHERHVSHPPGIAVEAGPSIEVGASRGPWSDDKGFRYAAVGRLEGRAMVLARRNYDMGEFATLAPTDLAIGWGALSDPRVVEQLKFPQYKSFSARFVVPELRGGSELAKRPWPELEAMFATFTHVHTIPGDAAIGRTLSGIRPGQVIRFKATLVNAVGPSGASYASSLALGDRNCEVAWIDELELE